MPLISETKYLFFQNDLLKEKKVVLVEVKVHQKEPGTISFKMGQLSHLLRNLFAFPSQGDSLPSLCVGRTNATVFQLSLSLPPVVLVVEYL